MLQQDLEAALRGPRRTRQLPGRGRFSVVLFLAPPTLLLRMDRLDLPGGQDGHEQSSSWVPPPEPPESALHGQTCWRGASVGGAEAADLLCWGCLMAALWR